MSGKGGENKDPSERVSRSSLATKKDENEFFSYLLFICLSVGLSIAIGCLSTALTKSGTYSTGPASRSSEVHNGSSQDPREAMAMFSRDLEHNPESPEAMLGYAKSLDALARIEKSKSLKENIIQAYRAIVDLANRNRDKVPDEILKEAGITCARRMGKKGLQSRTIRVLNELIGFFPHDMEIRNELGKLLVRMDRGKEAQEVFRKVLSIDPNNGYAQVHYGFSLMVQDQNYTESIKYLKLAMDNGVEETNHPLFHIHLGDCYLRLGEREKAFEVYEKGVEKGKFVSKYQRSVNNVPRLKSKPLWKLEETTHEKFFKKLEKNWQKIRDEGAKVLGMKGPNGFFLDKENLSDTGAWKQFELYSRGKPFKKNCEKTPFTCSLFRNFPAASRCTRGQVKFSVMDPGTHVWAHTGPTNCRLRAHLGLITPPEVTMRMENVNITWTEGKVFVMDDSFEHEVWHEGTVPRLILIVDFWHPDLTPLEHMSLKPV